MESQKNEEWLHGDTQYTSVLADFAFLAARP